jgi:hypothetical protein
MVNGCKEKFHHLLYFNLVYIYQIESKVLSGRIYFEIPCLKLIEINQCDVHSKKNFMNVFRHTDSTHTFCFNHLCN